MLGERIIFLAIARRVRRHTHVMHRVGVDHLVGVDIRCTHAIRSQLILAVGRRPGAVLGLNRLGLLRITEKRDGEAAVGLEVVVPGQELALAAFCAQAFPKRYFAWDSNLRPSRMLGLSAGRSLN